MSVFTNTGIGPTNLTNSAATVYTVPASTTLVIESITVANTSGSAATFSLSVGTDAVGTRLFAAVSVPANTTMQVVGRWVVAAGTAIQSYSGTNAVLNLTMGGFTVS